MVLKLNGNFKLHKHQKNAIKKFFTISKSTNKYGIKGIIINHEMGLGKTLTSLIIVLLYNKMYGKKNHVNCVYICPKTIISEVLKDAKKFLSSNFKILVAHGDFMNIDQFSYKMIKNNDLIITTYETVVSSLDYNGYKNYLRIYDRDNKSYHCSKNDKTDFDKNIKGKSLFHDIIWDIIIADESQKMGNIRNKRSRAMLSLMSKRSICLTGTSIKNRPGELLTQYKFIGFNQNVKDKDWFKYFIEHKLTKYMSIRDFKNTNILLPPIFVENIIIPILGKHRKIYDYCSSLSNKISNDINMNGINMLSKINRLRQVSNIPFPKYDKNNDKSVQLHKSLNKITNNYLNNIDSVCVCAKIKECARIINYASKNNDKVLLYSMFTYSFPIIEKGLKKLCSNNIQIFILSGQTKNRSVIIDDFRKYNGSSVMITNYSVGSTGLNLYAANYVILFERWWNNAVMNQGVARAYRYGQTKPVYVYFLAIVDSIETSLIDKICKNKDDMIDQFIEPARKDSKYYDSKKDYDEIMETL